MRSRLNARGDSLAADFKARSQMVFAAAMAPGVMAVSLGVRPLSRLVPFARYNQDESCFVGMDVLGFFFLNLGFFFLRIFQ